MTNRRRERVVRAGFVFGLGLVPAGAAHACPTMVPCIPSACLTMQTRADRPPLPPGVAGGGTYTSHNVALLSRVPVPAMGGGPFSTVSSLTGWVDPLTQREYAIVGRSNGTAVVDVTNPASPVYVVNVPSANTTESLWREPKVLNGWAYIGVDGVQHAVQRFNLAQAVRSYAGTTVNVNAGIYGGPSPSIMYVHTVAVNPDNPGYVYASGSNVGNGGLYAIDVRQPQLPRFAGNFAADGYTHEAQVVTYRGPDAQYQGREIAFNSNGDFATGGALSILDVTDKAAMTRIAKRGYAGAGYVHQGWLTEDHRYFFQNDELDEFYSPPGQVRTRTHLWDLADLDNPVYRGFFTHQTTSIDHNLYVKDGYVYETNYTTGLRVLKIGNLASTNPSDWLSEVAYFDTYPAHDLDSFDGAWNNYPYLPSGNVLVSDIDGGLFVLRATVPEPAVGAMAMLGLLLPALWRGGRRG